MKIKIFGIALMLGLAAALGACETGGGGGGEATVSPAAEPADTGAATPPAAETPAATPTN